eukprot:jgi/Chlat1/2900/Chrsp2S08903
MELCEGLRLVECAVVVLDFVRKQGKGVGQKGVDAWQLRELTKALLQTRAALTPADADLAIDKRPAQLHHARTAAAQDVPAATMRLRLWDSDGAQVVSAMDGTELSIGGVRLVCRCRIADGDSIDKLRTTWESIYGVSSSGYKSASPGERPDTITLHNIPHRWLAEPRVSTKPSFLVTHGIMSKLGEVRTLEIVDQDASTSSSGSLTPTSTQPDRRGRQVGLQLQRFQTHNEFLKALEVLSGKLLKKDGSPLVVDYNLAVDTAGFFSEKNVRARKMEKQRLQRAAEQAATERSRREEIEKRRKQLEEERRAAEAKAEADRLKRQEEERQQAEAERLRVEEEERMQEELEERGRREKAERRAEEQRLAAIADQERLEAEERAREADELARRMQKAREELAELEETKQRMLTEIAHRTQHASTVPTGAHDERDDDDHRDAHHSLVADDAAQLEEDIALLRPWKRLSTPR